MAKSPNLKGTNGNAKYDASDVTEHETHHVVPLMTYHIIFALLMVLLVITLAAAALDLGTWNVVIAMLIAVVKATLVVLFFMHVKYSSRLVQVFAGAAFFWLAILFILIFSDYTTRGWMPIPGR